MFELSLGGVVLLAHVVAGVWLVGASLFAPFVRRAIIAAPSVESLLAWLDFGRRTTAINPAMAIVLLASGIYLGSAGWWSTGWFWVAAVSWFVNSLLAATVLQRSAVALAKAAAAAGHGPVGPALDALRRSRRWHLAEQAMWASDVGMLYVMFMKPPALEACLVIGALFAASSTWHALGERRATAAAPAES